MANIMTNMRVINGDEREVDWLVACIGVKRHF